MNKPILGNYQGRRGIPLVSPQTPKENPSRLIIAGRGVDGKYIWWLSSLEPGLYYFCRTHAPKYNHNKNAGCLTLAKVGKSLLFQLCSVISFGILTESCP
jgi:hypothetical protein